MFRTLFLLFIIIPIIEIFLLIEVGSRIGSLMTIAVIIFTAAAGAFLLRLQGISTLAKVRAQLQQAQLPAVELVEGLILLVCGALLMTPGFFTDAIGFICLVPQFRKQMAKYFINYAMQQRQRNQNRPQEGVIDAEYWSSAEHTIEPQEPPDPKR